MCVKYLILICCIERLLQYYPTFFFRWYRKHKVCLTCAKSNDGLQLFKGFYLSNNREIWEAVQVYTALLHDNYTFRSHANALYLSIEIQLLKLVDLEIVPHNDFILGPLGVRTTADKCHYILSVEHFNDANTSMQLPAQLQLQGVTLINLEARLRANRDTTLILVEAEKDDFIGVFWLILLGCRAATESRSVERTGATIVGNASDRTWVIAVLRCCGKSAYIPFDHVILVYNYKNE